MLEVVDDELIPQASARFGKEPVTFIEDLPAVAIPTTVYEWFEDYRCCGLDSSPQLLELATTEARSGRQRWAVFSLSGRWK